MTVREYIGARYVPLFMGDYDETATYEPLSIVTYHGDSYTSRKHVPAGIVPTNTEYWAITGNYNAQVEHYRSEVVAVSNSLGEIQEDVDANTESITTISGNLETVTDDVAAIKANSWVTTNRIADDAVTTDKIADGSITKDKIAANAIDFSMLSNGEMVVIGDSYSKVGNNPLTDMWWYLLAQRLNVTPHSYAENGTAFVKTTPSPNFHAQLELAAADTSFDNDNVKYVFIYGGYNDCYDATGIGGSNIWIATRDCLIYAKQNFQNALIVIAGCNTNKNLYANDTTHWNQQIYAQLMANAVNTQEGAVFIDLTQLFVGEYDFIDNATDHPNAAGQKAIAQAFLNGIYGMNPYTNMHTILDITSQITSGTANSLWLVKHQGVWGISGTQIRAGESGMFTFNIPHNIWTMLPDNCPCIMDSASGQVSYAAIIAGNPGYFNGFANQSANCFITWNVNQKREYMRQGASHTYTI